MAIAAMAESRLAGAGARAREWLPVPLALATVGALLAYGGLEMALSIWHHRPLLLAQGALARGDSRRALPALREAASRYPQVPDLRLQLARALGRAGHWDEAARILQEQIRHRPGDLLLLQELLSARVNAGDWPGALDVVERLRRRFPDHEGLLSVQAHILMELKRWTDAETLYRRLLRAQPNDPTLLNNLAYLYADGLKRNLADACKMARRATEAEPKNGVFWDTLAWVYFRQGELDDAYAAQREAVILAPKEPEIHFHMGAIQHARGDLAAAAAEYRRALQLNPALAEARDALDRLPAAASPGVSPAVPAAPDGPS
jgi:Flp pilus assembly protein TadD